MSKQTIQDVGQSTYYGDRLRMALSCGCEYNCTDKAKIGMEAYCPRCPITIPASDGLGVKRFTRIEEIDSAQS